ncbi:MAG: tetratricopeptide repeat protein, partial [Lautropia sp.]
QAVLDGGVQREGARLRHNARLLRTGDGRLLWSGQFDEHVGDIFTVQDAIARQVWAALMPDLLAAPSPTLRRHTRDAEAYQWYLTGRYFRVQRIGADGLREARTAFARAIARDPGFALAWVGLAETDSILGVFGVTAPHSVFPGAIAALDRALTLAPDLGEAHAALGHVKIQYEHDWTGAERAFERAIQLNPGYSPAWQWRGLAHAYAGRFEQGIDDLRRAQSLDPGPIYSALIGMVRIYQRQYDAAIVQLEQTLAMAPDAPATLTYLAVAYLRTGRHEQALALLDRIRGPTPGLAAYRSQAHLLAGRRDEAIAERDRLIAQSAERYVPAYDIAAVQAALGDRTQALDWLERALDERSTLVGWMPWEPVFDGLRDEPRYVALAARLARP